MFKYLIIAVSAYFVLASCKKNDPSPNTNECYNFENIGPINYFSSTRIHYKAPYFNPLNDNEIVYNYIDYQLGEYQLRTYNLLTGSSELIADQVKTFGQPKWSRNGWIAYDNILSNSNSIWRVKSNGDSLTHVLPGLPGFFPVWSASSQFLLFHHSPVLGVPYYMLREDVYTGTIDTVGFTYFGYHDISSQNKIASRTFLNNQHHLAVSDASGLLNPSSVLNLQQEELNNIQGLTWHPDSKHLFFTLIFSDKGGLYKLNTQTGELNKLNDFCSSKRYEYISCSKDGTKIICERVNTVLIGNAEMRETSTIVMLNLLTGEEKQILPN